MWLTFETSENRQKLPPALGEICVKLAGLPDALTKVGEQCQKERPGQMQIPQLRIHAHVMAATYDHGASAARDDNWAIAEYRGAVQTEEEAAWWRLRELEH